MFVVTGNVNTPGRNRQDLKCQSSGIRDQRLIIDLRNLQIEKRATYNWGK
jgi:hypothetical protein